MELEPGIKLFGFFTNNQHHLRRNLPPTPPPPPALQDHDQEPQLPSTTLSLTIQPSVEILRNEAGFKPFGPRLRAPQPQHLRYRDLIALRRVDGNTLKLLPHATDKNVDDHARISMPCTTLSLSIHSTEAVDVKPKKNLKRPRQEPESPSTTLSLSIHPAKKIIKRPRLRAPDPEDLPSIYREFLVGSELKGNNLKLVYTRTLHATDISDHHARLSMPCKQVKADFLTPGEEELIHQSVREGKRALKKKIDVTVVDPSLNICRMKLAKWNDDDVDVVDTDKMKRKRKSWWFAPTNDWMELVKDNGLGVGDGIQVWSFRMMEGAALGFIIHKIGVAANGEIVDNSEGSGLSIGSHKRRRLSN